MSKISSVRRGLVCTAALIAALWASSLPAGAQSTGTFTASPTSALAGSSISVASVTPCTLPAGVTGAPLVRATLTRGSTALADVTITVDASGSWRGTVRVPPGTSAGPAELSAFCIASPQAEGAVFEYTAVTIQVAAGQLARTGDTSAAAIVSGAIALLLGLALRFAARPVMRV
jgi:hypothetical protein